MASTLFQILIAVMAVSLISVIGIFIFSNKKIIDRALFFLVSFAAGTMLGAAFLDLLPDALEQGFRESIPILILTGVLSFFALEKFLHWHHHHTGREHEEIHAFTYLNLVGDGIHNFVDGVIIAISFMSSTELGIAATIAIIAHEIPQEIGDFGVLIYGGFSKLKAIAFNFLSALTSFVGALSAYFYSSYLGNSSVYILSFAIGGFVYIAGTDLIPEIQKETNLRKSFLQLALMLTGILLIWAVGILFEGH